MTAILVNGASAKTRISGLTIQDVLNDAPNTCALTFDDVVVPVGTDSLRITEGSTLLFAGNLQTVDLSYIGKTRKKIYPCTAIDSTAAANRRRPFGSWTATSATTIANSITATYATGVSNAGIAASLAAVSVIFDGSLSYIGCLAKLAQLIGGYCKVEDSVAYLFLTDTSSAPDDIDDTPGRFINDPPIAKRSDSSQLLTRAYGKGGGGSLTSDVLSSETILPLSDVSKYAASGQVLTSDGAILSYTSVQVLGTSTLVGPPAAPTAAPSPVVQIGTGLGTGVYKQAYTFVTGAGESLPSPLATVTTGTMPDPTVAPTISNTGGAGDSWGNGGGVVWEFRYHYSSGTTDQDLTALTKRSPVSNQLTPNGTQITFSCPYSTDPGVTYVVVVVHRQDLADAYRTWLTPAARFVITNVPAGGTLSVSLSANGIGNLQNPADTNTTTALRLGDSGVALGPATTTSRKIYRTAVGGSQLKLQQTIANNTATVGVQDVTADGSLGANVPTTDTSGLTITQGQINAGSTTLDTAGWSGPSAGWANVGSQAVRYTGVTGNQLTGIPASGAGSLLATVRFGTIVAPAPSLLGITGLSAAMLKGAAINVWVQRDDTTAQGVQAALDSAAGLSPADGIYEGPPIVDTSLDAATMAQHCDAKLAQLSYPIVTVTYACRDLKTKSGKTVHIHVTNPPIGPYDLAIQDVTIDEIGVHSGLNPRFTVTASTMRYSLDDILRRLIQDNAAAGTGAP